jgi:hypothetical protein
VRNKACYYIQIIYIDNGKITRAPRCLGTMLNTYKIRDVLYIPRGMYDLYIPSRYEWGMYTLGMMFFLAYIPWVCKKYIYMRNMGMYILDMCIPDICILGMHILGMYELGIRILDMYTLGYA